jgi:integrase
VPATFRTKHHRNSAPRYMRWIPEPLQPLFNGKTRLTKQLKPMDEREVARTLRAIGARDDQLFRTLERLPAERKEEIRAAGGIEAIRARYNALTGDGPDDLIPEEFLLSDDFSDLGITSDDPRADQVRLGMLAQLKEQRAEAAERAAFVQRIAPLMLQAAPAPEMGLEGLFDLWVRVKAPKITRKHKSTLALFKACLARDVDFRSVTVNDVQGFCDHLRDTGHSPIGQVKHLDALRGLFSAAIPRYRKDNPGRGVKPEGKVKRGKGVPFTGPELSVIMAQAEATRFGGKRHVAVMWLLRLAVWTGARINELAQLRKDDVAVESGVARIWIREGDGQSVKTGDDRKVPLHPSIADAFLAYAKVSKTDFIFDCFPNGEKGRAAWLICNFPSFRRDACKIDGKATLHGMRHRFKDACTNAGVAEERCRALMGHSASDVHSRYGQGAGLKQLAADVAKLEPFAD